MQLVLESIISILASGYSSKTIFFTKCALEYVPLISDDRNTPTTSSPDLTILLNVPKSSSILGWDDVGISSDWFITS